jgi:NAD(P)H-hydrate epimerase
MKILTAKEIKECDGFTIENEGIPSINLMERAAQKCADYINSHFIKSQKVYVFCGSGNNGGDGFAIARMLYHNGFDVEVLMDKEQVSLTKDAQANLEKVKNISWIDVVDFDGLNTGINEDSIIIDAIFGSGLNRKIEGKTAKIIRELNTLKACKIAIDVPSGVVIDGNLPDNSVVFNADITLSFQSYKKAFLHPETGKFCGRIVILDINLHQDFINNTESKNYIIDGSLISKIYQPRKEFSHKGNFGKTCIVAGSFGKIGAAVLATKSALRTGSGLTYICAPKCGYEILQSTCPEAMFLNGGEDSVVNFEAEEGLTYGIGPGLGEGNETQEKFLNFLKILNEPLVLDADALNILAKYKESLNLIPKNSIITPHPKEFERLFGITSNSFERLDLAMEKSRELNIYIVLKDHFTQIITPEGNVYYNVTGNSGLAKGGSGDVLLGIITSLLAQNYSPEEAAVFGVWLHGKAADIASEGIAKEAMLATDVIDNISEVFIKINK